jgi:hypothetical protein
VEHSSKPLWVHREVRVVAQPSARGARVVGLVFRGVLIMLSQVTESDYQVAFGAGGAFTPYMEGGSGSARPSTPPEGGGAALRGYRPQP